MPMCFPSKWTEEKYIASEDILIKTNHCEIYMSDEGHRIPAGGPAVLSYTVSKRTEKYLKNAYVKLGAVSLGWFSASPAKGIFIEEIELPTPFEWKINWPNLENLIDSDVREKIMKEFGINIELYVGR